MKPNKDIIKILADILDVNMKDKDANDKLIKKLKTADVPNELKQSAMSLLSPTIKEGNMNFKEFRKKLLEHGSTATMTSSDATKPTDNNRQLTSKVGYEEGKFADTNMDIEDGMEELSDDEIEQLSGNVNDLEDLVDLGGVDSDELHMINGSGDSIADVVDDKDEEQGESSGKMIKTKQMGESAQLDEVLTALDRIKRRQVFARSEAKRQRGMKMAFHTQASPERIHERARRTAVNLFKMKLAKKPLDQLTLPEKQRIEKIVAKKGATIAKLTLKLLPKVKAIQSKRLHPR